METYISILRGINVGGQKKIRMADLKTLYERLKFKEITTYIQSGNVIFNTDKSLPRQEISKRIEEKITEKYNFIVPVIIRTKSEMVKTFSDNPFLDRKDINPERLHVTFLAGLPKQADKKRIEKLEFPPDEFIIDGKEIYLHCPNGYGKTKLSNNFFENRLNVTATTRNWRTISILVSLAVNK